MTSSLHLDTTRLVCHVIGGVRQEPGRLVVKPDILVVTDPRVGSLPWPAS
ncbi:hypothetical protein [Ornithinimicrobium murale]|nr:hypothetical protein [Ornithinimicrobium murale]